LEASECTHAPPCRQQLPPATLPNQRGTDWSNEAPQAPHRPHRAQAAAKRRRHSRGPLIRGHVRQTRRGQETEEGSSTKAFFFPSCISEHLHRDFGLFSHRYWNQALALYSAHTALSFFSLSTRLVIQRRVLRLQIDDLRVELGRGFVGMKRGLYIIFKDYITNTSQYLVPDTSQRCLAAILT
jgi:hypothetical protein